ncbi:MAG TPA: sulfatase-like hydrolase/transferase [Geomonas sp.]|nr:sulfatase-like hydrolase/transferase [Geomonas sp.]
MFSKGALRDLFVAFSIVNLWLIRIWLKILPYNEGSNFFLPFSPLNTYLAAILNVLLWGVLLWLLVRKTKRRPGLFAWVVLCVFLVTALLVAYGIGVAYISVGRFVFLFGGQSAFWLSVGCWSFAAAAVFLLVRYRLWLAKYYAVLPILFSPYLLITLSESMQAVAKVEPAAHFRPHQTAAASLRNPLKHKVVWVIFDETDYRLGFEKRPSFLSLPAFDSFKATALFAGKAYSPNDNTQTSLPALLTGLPLTKTVPVAAGKLDLVLMGTGAHRDFGQADTIFRQVKERGGSTALLGWYLPYSRVMKDVDLCHDYARFNVYTSESLLDVLFHQWREVLDMRFLPIKNTMLAENQIGIVTSMRKDVANAIETNDPSFMFLHFSVPHSPNVYHRQSGELAFNRDKRLGYFDNLALADRCLAELRKELEKKGLWDSSLVIVSSDHHWRTNTYDQKLDKQHVPFLAKFPGQRSALTYDGTFNTLLTKELILQVFDGKVNSPEDACRWLDRARQQKAAPVVISAVQPDAD